MTDITLSGHAYRISRLGALTQFHLARKFAFVLFGLSSITDPKDATDQAEAFSRAICAMAGNLSDAEVNDSINLAFSAVSRQETNGAWAPVVTRDGKTLTYQDITMTDMLKLVWYVIKEHDLQSFFTVPRSASTEEAPQPA